MCMFRQRFLRGYGSKLTTRQIRYISREVGNLLLSKGEDQTLYHDIAQNPINWIKLSSRLQSKRLFKESLIHAAGLYYTDTVQQDVHTVEPTLAAFIERKAKTIRVAVRDMERECNNYYPEELKRKEDRSNDEIRMRSYADQTSTWLPLVIFRHWLTSRICSDEGHNAVDMGFALMSIIKRGRDGYLAEEALRQWHETFNMVPKGKATIMENLLELKSEIRHIVKPLFRSRAMLDLEQYPVQHFTCLEVGPKSYPWVARDDAEGDDGTAGAKPTMPKGLKRKAKSEDLRASADAPQRARTEADVDMEDDL